MGSKYKYIKIITLAIVIILHSNCKKTEIEQSTLVGSIKGRTFIKKEKTSSNIVHPQEGIKVQVEGTDLYAISGENGNYEIKNIPFGTYNLIYSFEGHVDMKKCGIQILGNEYPKRVTWTALSKESNTIASNLQVESLNNAVKFSADFTPNADGSFERGFFLCIHNNENVAYDYNLDYYYATVSSGGKASCYVTKELLSEWVEGFNPEKKYYAVAYGFSDNYSSYFDPEKGSYVHTGLNSTPTNVVSFSIPDN